MFAASNTRRAEAVGAGLCERALPNRALYFILLVLLGSLVYFLSILWEPAPDGLQLGDQEPTSGDLGITAELSCNLKRGTLVLLAPPRHASPPGGVHPFATGIERFCLLLAAVRSFSKCISVGLKCPYDIHILIASDYAMDPTGLDGPYTDSDRAQLVAQGHPSKVIFVEIPMYSGDALEPGVSLHQAKRWSAGEDGATGGRPLGYRSMCRLYSGRLQAMPFLKSYKYYMRMDDDNVIRSVPTSDPFIDMEERRLRYAWRRDEVDHWGVAAMWPLAQEYLQPEYTALNATSEGPGWIKRNMSLKEITYTGGQPYNNFHVSEVALWATKTMRAFWDVANANNLFLKHRLGDANYHAMVIMMLPQNAWQRWPDFPCIHNTNDESSYPTWNRLMEVNCLAGMHNGGCLYDSDAITSPFVHKNESIPKKCYAGLVKSDNKPLEDPRVSVEMQRLFSLRYGHTLSKKRNPCMNGNERCVITFGLYGSSTLYLRGALRNIQLAPVFWPGWRLRFYIDDSVPADFIRQLQTPISEVALVSGVPGKIAGMFWRFFVVSDSSVDRFLVRDTDSSPSSSEAAAITEWILSGRRWHRMFDNPVHYGWPLMGGMFGGRKETPGVGTPAPLSYELVEGLIRSGNVSKYFVSKGGDQDFLQDYIWPHMAENRSDILTHDSCQCLVNNESMLFPTRRLGPNDFVGGLGFDVDNETLAQLITGQLKTEPWLVKPFPSDASASGMGECPIECRPPEHKDWNYC